MRGVTASSRRPPNGAGDGASRQAPFERRLREQLTLTRLSVMVGMIASVVGILAVFGLVGGDGSKDSQRSTGTEPASTEDEPAIPMAGSVYSGSTDQGEPMHFQVSVDGRTIHDLTVPMQGECSDGGPFTSTYRQGEATFVITGENLSGNSTIHGATGEIVGGIFRMEARFGDSGETVSGTVSEHAEIKDGSTCDTPKIKFEATAEST